MYHHPTDLKRTLQMRCREGCRQVAAELRTLRSPGLPPAKLAAAFALGTLISFVPVPLIDSLLVGLVLTRFKQVNRAPIFIARLIWNDFLVYPLYGAGYRWGSTAVVSLADGAHPVLGSSAVIAVTSLLAAALILAAAASAAGYLFFYVGLRLLRGATALK